MNNNECDGNDEDNDKEQEKRSQNQNDQPIYYQIGAPSLIYDNYRTRKRILRIHNPAHHDGYVLDDEDDDRVLDRLPLSGERRRWNFQEINDHVKRINRSRAYWSYPPGLSLARDVATSKFHVQKKKRTVRHEQQEMKANNYLTGYSTDDMLYGYEFGSLDDNIHKTTDDCEIDGDIHNPYHPLSGWSVERSRLQMLLNKDGDGINNEVGDDGLDDDLPMIRRNCQIISDSSRYEYPFITTRRGRRYKPQEGAISTVDLTREYNIRRINNSEPAYLAPFDNGSIHDAMNCAPDVLPQNTKTIGLPPRQRQANTLLTFSCPMKCCSYRTNGSQNDDRSHSSHGTSWTLIHPVGPMLDELCVSKLISPNAFNRISNEKSRQSNQPSIHKATLDIGDTILEIRQCGSWTKQSTPQLTIIARTGSYIVIVSVSCNIESIEKCDESGEELHEIDNESTTIHGNCFQRRCKSFYTLERKEKLDYRSMYRSVPSLYPVSLTTHPRFCMPFCPSKFAAVYHSSLPSKSCLASANIVQSYSYDEINGRLVSVQKHTVANLRSIDLIDFTSNHPMCLWSAASSHVRPALSPGIYDEMKKQIKAPFGLGNSLYSIDLRTNKATFQWSPSAEEMVTEGIHSINGIRTDWNLDNVVWVTSRSAGKTWQIDGRMPCRVVNFWSLTSTCDDNVSSKIPNSGFHGEPSLLIAPTPTSNSRKLYKNGIFTFPIIKVDTDYGVNGFSMFQSPSRKPRFQTESVQCAASRTVSSLPHASITMNSYFALPDVSDTTYVCGVSTVRVPVSELMDEEKIEITDDDDNDDGVEDSNINKDIQCNSHAALNSAWKQCCNRKSTALCVLTATNHGDVYQHALLESDSQTEDKGITEHLQHFEGLPIGTSAIPVPNECDCGKEKMTVSAHDNMQTSSDLKVFLTNTYPIPYIGRIRRRDGNRRGSLDGSTEDILIQKTQKNCVTRMSYRSNEDVHPNSDEDIVSESKYEKSDSASRSMKRKVDQTNDYVLLKRKTQTTTAGVRLSSSNSEKEERGPYEGDEGNENTVSYGIPSIVASDSNINRSGGDYDDDDDDDAILILPKLPVQPPIRLTTTKTVRTQRADNNHHSTSSSLPSSNHSQTNKSDLSTGIIQRSLIIFDQESHDEDDDEEDNEENEDNDDEEEEVIFDPFYEAAGEV